MTRYCRNCKLPWEGEVCPECGEADLWPIMPEDPCLLTEQQWVWAGVLEEVLVKCAVPHMKQPLLGAGLVKSIGTFGERFRFFVPYEFLDRAREIAEGLFSAGGEEDDFDFDE